MQISLNLETAIIWFAHCTLHTAHCTAHCTLLEFLGGFSCILYVTDDAIAKICVTYVKFSKNEGNGRNCRHINSVNS